jgi:ribose transport system permease protein
VAEHATNAAAGHRLPRFLEEWRARAKQKGVRHYLGVYALVILTAAICIFFSLYPDTSESFPTSANLKAVLGNQAVIAIVALAALIPLILDEFDLSVGAIAGFSSIMTASFLSDGTPLLPAMAIGVLIGLGIGAFNGLVVTRVAVAGVITTLGTSIILRGVVTGKTEGESIVQGIPVGFAQFASDDTFGLPNTFWVMAAVAVATYYLLEHTPLGRYFYSYGSNPVAARLVGIRTRYLLFLSFAFAGLLSGVAGVLQTARAGGASPSVGDNFTLPALAAAFLSAAAIKPGKFNVGGSLVAIFFLAALNSGLNLAGAQAYVADIVNGTALIIGVAMAALLRREQVV